MNEVYEPVFTSSFRRYDSSFKQLDFVDYSNIKEGPKEKSAFEGPKLLLRRIVNRQLRIMATYSDKYFVVKKDISLFKPKDKKNIFPLLAILNSKLISFLLTKGSTSARKNVFTQMTLSDIRKIGIPIISKCKYILSTSARSRWIAKSNGKQGELTVLPE